MERIIAGCSRYRGNQKRIRTFILTMRYSGLRIGDTIALRKARLTGNKLLLRARKNEADVFVPLPQDVANSLRELENPSEYFFKNGKGKATTDRANWSRYLETIFELAEVPNAHSHRHRRTFACGLFSAGASIKQVATFLGDSPEVVAKHYSAHVKKHQDDIEALVSQTWASQNAATPASAAAATS
jgi:integrase